MAYEWVKVGAKCAFKGIPDGLWPVALGNMHRYSRLPEKGEICTISGITTSSRGESFIKVNEIICDDGSFFEAHLFAPVFTKTQKQDVEMFLSLLNRSPLERLDLLAERMNEMLG